ncbi:uncharacterized protein LOC120336585 [Styela clava]
MTFTSNQTPKERGLIRVHSLLPGTGILPGFSWYGFNPDSDQTCWIGYTSDICLNETKKLKCETRKWLSNVNGSMVIFECKPSKLQFKLSYEYIDCKTGKSSRTSPTTTSPGKTSQSPVITSSITQENKHKNHTDQSEDSSSRSTTSLQTVHQSPRTSAPTTNKGENTSDQSESSSSVKTTPQQSLGSTSAMLPQASIQVSTISASTQQQNAESTELKAKLVSISLMTIAIVSGSIVAVIVIAGVIGVWIYRKRRLQHREESIPVHYRKRPLATPPPVYEEIGISRGPIQQTEPSGDHKDDYRRPSSEAKMGSQINKYLTAMYSRENRQEGNVNDGYENTSFITEPEFTAPVDTPPNGYLEPMTHTSLSRHEVVYEVTYVDGDFTDPDYIYPEIVPSRRIQ